METVNYTVIHSLLPFTMPDFIQYERPAGKKEDGININDPGIPVYELSEKDANNYAELLKESFLRHWQQSQEMRRS